jgi:hypothetical protein
VTGRLPGNRPATPEPGFNLKNCRAGLRKAVVFRRIPTILRRNQRPRARPLWRRALRFQDAFMRINEII